MMTKPLLPTPFIWRRLHSLAGFGLVIFIIFHLITNSQAAFWIGDDGQSYIHSVNAIHEIAYLQIVELLLIALPLAIHAIWGIYYLRTGEGNAYQDVGNKPYLPEYGRNRAYTWQRITSWILLFGIIAHVVHMRFVESPISRQVGNETFYAILLERDPGLQSLSSRLGVELEENKDLPKGHVYAVAKNFGTAELLMVREAFKTPWIMALYSIFVLAACFHAFNGLWTFMITWGVTLSDRIQRIFLRFATFLMFLTTFLGLATIYLTYWVNLRS
jgi:succinate dehydrogenase / fumarate reductase cytochrome b subunit